MQLDRYMAQHGTLIGEGMFGRVYKVSRGDATYIKRTYVKVDVRHGLPGTGDAEVIIKVSKPYDAKMQEKLNYDWSEVDINKHAYDKLQRNEARMMIKARECSGLADHIPRFFWAGPSGQQYVTCMSVAPGQTVRKALPIMNSSARNQVIQQVNTLVDRLQSCRLYHADLHTDNVLVDPATMHVTIIDFGWAHHVGNAHPFFDEVRKVNNKKSFAYTVQRNVAKLELKKRQNNNNKASNNKAQQTPDAHVIAMNLVTNLRRAVESKMFKSKYPNLSQGKALVLEFHKDVQRDGSHPVILIFKSPGRSPHFDLVRLPEDDFMMLYFDPAFQEGIKTMMKGVDLPNEYDVVRIVTRLGEALVAPTATGKLEFRSGILKEIEYIDEEEGMALIEKLI